MSVLIPELSFTSAFTYKTTPLVNCEGYTQIGYTALSGFAGAVVQLEVSFDGINFYIIDSLSLPSTMQPYTHTQNITFKYCRLAVNNTSSPTSYYFSIQSFFFNTTLIENVTTGGTGINQITSSGVISVTNPTGPTTDLSISAASGSSSGYLTSTDWTTFNSKGNGTVTNVSGTGVVSVANGTTTPSISISQATTSSDGYLSSTDWNIFNGKGSGSVTSVGYVAGTGISISGTNPIVGSGTWTITNTSPDQTVALTAGSGISISGTYPNFTITNTSGAGTDRCIYACLLENFGYNTSLSFGSLTGTSNNASYNQRYMVSPSAGTMSNLYVNMNGTLTSNRTFTLYLNSTVTTLTVIITAGNTTASNNVNTVTIAAGDTMAWGVVDSPGSGPSGIDCAVSCLFSF